MIQQTTLLNSGINWGSVLPKDGDISFKANFAECALVCSGLVLSNANYSLRLMNVTTEFGRIYQTDTFPVTLKLGTFKTLQIYIVDTNDNIVSTSVNVYVNKETNLISAGDHFSIASPTGNIGFSFNTVSTNSLEGRVMTMSEVNDFKFLGSMTVGSPEITPEILATEANC